MERRSIFAASPEVSGNTIKGLAIVYDSETTIQDARGREFTEVVRPGSVNLVEDVVCCFNHDANELLGRTSSGTLKLEERKDGIYFECTLPQHQRDKIGELISRGDLRGCSFSFETRSDKWSTRDGKPFRELTGIKVHELGPVVCPAYDATQVDLRSVSMHEPKAPFSIVDAKLRLTEIHRASI